MLLFFEDLCFFLLFRLCWKQYWLNHEFFWSLKPISTDRCKWSFLELKNKKSLLLCLSSYFFVKYFCQILLSNTYVKYLCQILINYIHPSTDKEKDMPNVVDYYERILCCGYYNWLKGLSRNYNQDKICELSISLHLKCLVIYIVIMVWNIGH